MQSAHIANQEDRILTPDFQDTFDIPPPTDGSTGRTIQLWSTSYHTTQPITDKNGVPFRDINGVPISDNVSKKDWCLGAQEGSIKITFNGKDIRITDGGVFNSKRSYSIDCASELGSKDYDSYSRSYHLKTNAPFGLGIYDYFLVPYRSIAVHVNNNDALKLKRGDVLYIKEVTNNIVTDPYTGKKFKHDGYFFVADVGGKVKDNHADTFCGFKDDCLPPFTGGSNKTHVLSTALIITDPAIIEKLKKMHLKSSYR
jgi:3D (Asp-Asp-Asp) domain-containing protein